MSMVSGAPSTGTVAMNFGAVSEAGGKLVTYSGALTQLLESLNVALNPVRDTWYVSGSSSGAQAQAAEENLRRTLLEMTQIIQNLGKLLGNSAMDASALDSALGNRFPGATR
jgi:uncharacterized protein YukE